VADAVSVGRRSFGQKLIYLGIGTFIAACVVLLAFGSALAPASVSAPGFALAPFAKPVRGGVFQVTLDAADRQDWSGFSLGAGKSDEAAGVPADLYVRRYVLRAPLGAADLGEVPLESASLPAGLELVPDELVDGALQNRVLTGWYSYSYWTHLLRSKEHTYAVKLMGGGHAFVRILSYNCASDGTGCLTFQYRLAD
jgi:hypothetical protein